MNRRGFVRSLFQAAAIVALAPRLAFGAPKMQRLLGMDLGEPENTYICFTVDYLLSNGEVTRIKGRAAGVPLEFIQRLELDENGDSFVRTDTKEWKWQELKLD